MEKNKIATIVMGVSALFLLLSLLTHSWFSESKGKGDMEMTMGVGIWGSAKVEMCMSGKCESKTESMSFSDAKKGKDKAWLAFGKIGFLAGLLSVLALGAAAAMSWMGNPKLAQACLGSLGGCALTGLCILMFLFLKPDGLPGIGLSFFLGVLGVAGGITGAMMGKKVAAG